MAFAVKFTLPKADINCCPVTSTLAVPITTVPIAKEAVIPIPVTMASGEGSTFPKVVVNCCPVILTLTSVKAVTEFKVAVNNCPVTSTGVFNKISTEFKLAVNSNPVIFERFDSCEFIFQAINRDKLLLLDITRMRQQTHRLPICFYCRSPF